MGNVATRMVGQHLHSLSILNHSLYTPNLLADCYRYPYPVTGRRNYSDMEAVKPILGETMSLICGWIQYGNLTMLVIGYTITTAKSMVKARCKFSNNPHMIGLGIVEILLSQIPNFHKLSWLSTIAALMSFVYASIGIGLSIQKMIH
ncbi:hypothetical protein UlMin_034839, partial [Ulmus minor]